MQPATQALLAATRRLKDAGVPDAANDARKLLAHALNVDRGRLTLILPDPMPDDAQLAFTDMITARCMRQPVSQITGTRSFYGRDFIVTSDVLDPRPDTELLIDTTLTLPFETVLDLGTGTGCILLTLLAERGTVTGQGSDASDAALSVATQNATALQLGSRAKFITSDWFNSLSGRFDLITSNPPYIRADEMPNLAPEVRDWEPEMALTPGGDGLDAYRIICAGAPKFLNSGGYLIVEIGHLQSMDVCTLFEGAGFTNVRTEQDIDNHDRVVCGQLK